MHFENIIIELAVIYTGAALLATCFLLAKQPIVISYILVGIITGPYALGLISNSEHIENISHIGIILLLFLIGLNLHPNKLVLLFKKAAGITILSCLIFAALPLIISLFAGYKIYESLIIGFALMFSSTVIGMKLTPTTDIHNKRIGELMIGILLFQDIIAISVISFLKGSGETPQDSNIFILFLQVIIKNMLMIIASFLCVKYILLNLFKKFDVIKEYIFVVSLGWCMLVAAVAGYLGMSYELGGFIAGVSLAISPVSLVISENLKPIREFFLILFFFTVGAQFNPLLAMKIFPISLVIAGVLLTVKPLVLWKGFQLSGENVRISKELGIRLGQASEFGLIVAYVGLINNKISQQAASLIQLTVILTFIISTYIVVKNYPTPISADKAKRRD